MKPILYPMLAAIACGLAYGQTAFTNPVGYVTIPIPGTNNAAAQKVQIASQGLLPSGSVKYAGDIESYGSDVNGTFFQDDEGTWANDDFVTAGSLGPMVSHLVEITSGTMQGTMTWITKTVAKVPEVLDPPTPAVSAKIYTSDDISAAGTGVSFRVLKTFTVSSLFGTPPAASTLGGAGTITAADTVQILDPLGGPTQTFWYKNAGGSPATWGWKATVLPSGVAAVDVPLIAIHPNDGMIIYRKQAADGSLVINGDVKLGNTKIRIEGNGTSSVYNIVATQIPSDTLTMSASNLYTGDASTGIKGAGTITAADTIQIWDSATNSFISFWYKNAGGSPATWGWKASGLVVVPDPANYVIPAANAIMIERKAGNPFAWNVPAAYTPPAP